MPLLDTDYDEIDQFIEDFGDSLTIKEVSHSYDSTGDLTTSTTDRTGQKGFVETLPREEIVSDYGRFAPGDVRIFFKSDQSYASVGNRVTIGSDDYEMIEVDRPGVTEGHYEVIVRKI